MKGLSLFSGAGIGETYLSNSGIDVVVANELIEKRAKLHEDLYPSCKMICGDINDQNIFNQIISESQGVEFIIASPPCQGMSVAGKNRSQNTMIGDERNHLINRVFDAIELLKPQYVLIENVPALLKIQLPYKGNLHSVVEILKIKFGDEYNIEARVVDASDYGVPQIRLRAIVKMYPKDATWKWPDVVKKKVTVRDVIGNLPSFEAGE